MPQYRRNTAALQKYGFEWLVVHDYDFFREKVEKSLGVEIAPYNEIAGTRKAGDFDPAYGQIFAKELEGYDFWGHTGLDCAYGRLDRFVSDEFLAGCDVFGNDPGAICGPFSLYRNTERVNSLFRRVPNWERLLGDARMCGFDEIQFNEVVQKAARDGEIRFKTAFWQSNDHQAGHGDGGRMTIRPDGTLWDDVKGSETMMFHFNRTRKWVPEFC
jgi:hypothetical protein